MIPNILSIDNSLICSYDEISSSTSSIDIHIDSVTEGTISSLSFRCQVMITSMHEKGERVETEKGYFLFTEC